MSYGLIHIYFIPWATIHYYFISFIAHFFSCFEHQVLFQVFVSPTSQRFLFSLSLLTTITRWAWIIHSSLLNQSYFHESLFLSLRKRERERERENYSQSSALFFSISSLEMNIQYFLIFSSHFQKTVLHLWDHGYMSKNSNCCDLFSAQGLTSQNWGGCLTWLL
jgi:hypothetical protein